MHTLLCVNIRKKVSVTFEPPSFLLTHIRNSVKLCQLKEIFVILLFYNCLLQKKGGREEAVHWETLLHLRPVNPPLYLSLGQWCRHRSPCTEPVCHSRPEKKKKDSVWNNARAIS